MFYKIFFLFLFSIQSFAADFPSVLSQLSSLLEQSRAARSWEEAKVVEEMQANFFDNVDEEAACESLKLFSANDLVLFENEIKNLASCREVLQERLEAKYEADRQELRHLYPEVNSEAAAAVDCEGLVGDAPPIEVAYAGGPAYGSYNTLPSQSPHTRKVPGLAPKEVIVTLDDGPSPARTQKALDAMAQHCVHGTFFLVGEMTVSQSAMATIKMSLDQGHNVGNHTYNHPIFTKDPLTSEQRLDQIIKNQNRLLFLMGEYTRAEPRHADLYQLTPFFRFPGGSETIDALTYLREHDLASFTWEAGANDWLPDMTPAKELAEALKEIEATKGGILLLHDIKQATVDMMPYLFVELAKRGYKVRQMVPDSEQRDL